MRSKHSIASSIPIQIEHFLSISCLENVQVFNNKLILFRPPNSESSLTVNIRSILSFIDSLYNLRIQQIKDPFVVYLQEWDVDGKMATPFCFLHLLDLPKKLVHWTLSYAIVGRRLRRSTWLRFIISIASFHCVSFAGPSLPVGKNCAMVTVNNAIDELVYAKAVIDLLLRTVWRKYLIKLVIFVALRDSPLVGCRHASAPKTTLRLPHCVFMRNSSKYHIKGGGGLEIVWILWTPN